MGGNEWNGEVMYGKDKESLNILLRAYAVKKNGEITTLVGVYTDISERKLAMEALREREDCLFKIMIAAIDGMWDWDKVTNKAYFDQLYYQMAGYEPNKFDHELEEFQQRVYPDDIDRVMGQALKHVNGETDCYIEEFRYKKRNGDWLWIPACG